MVDPKWQTQNGKTIIIELSIMERAMSDIYKVLLNKGI